MASRNNFFRQVLTDLEANKQKKFTNLNLDFQRDNDNFPCNFLYFKNDSNNKVSLELNDDELQRFEVEGNGGTFIINYDDFIDYTSVNIVEENGNALNGRFIITGAVTRPRERLVDSAQVQ